MLRCCLQDLPQIGVKDYEFVEAYRLDGFTGQVGAAACSLLCTGVAMSGAGMGSCLHNPAPLQ